jgi:hypothetical protein
MELLQSQLDQLTRQTCGLHRVCVKEILDNDFYTRLFELTIAQEGLTLESLLAFDNVDKVFGFWNAFWFNLPDSPSIHRHPFYLVCDLAEGDYLRDCQIIEDDINERAF